MNKILFSERLVARRKECGYKTQYALAEEYNKRFPSSRKNRKEENSGNSSGILGTIKHYENGNYNGSPKLDIVDNLCKILECNVDYLLGNINCKTHDIQFIQQYTGLSEKAINYLHDKSRSKRYVNILNIFLNYGNFDNALFHIDRYMENVYLYQELTKIRRERRKKIISECIQNYGDLISYNYPYNDTLDKKIKDTEEKMNVEEFKIDQHFKFIIQQIERIAKEKAPDTN